MKYGVITNSNHPEICWRIFENLHSKTQNNLKRQMGEDKSNTDDLPKPNQGNMNNLSRLVIDDEIEAVMKSLLQREAQSCGIHYSILPNF